MTVFYLVRHGEPDWCYNDRLINEQYRLKGHGRDLAPLTAAGMEQAKMAAADSRIRNSELIVSSPYTRALQTAAIIVRETGLELRVEVDLREWQPDLTFEYDSLDRLHALKQDYQNHHGIYPPDAAKVWESKTMLKQRMEAVLEKYRHFPRVTVVAHGEIFRTQKNLEELPYCSVTELIKEF